MRRGGDAAGDDMRFDATTMRVVDVGVAPATRTNHLKIFDG